MAVQPGQKPQQQAQEQSQGHSQEQQLQEQPPREALPMRTFDKDTFRWEGVDLQQYKLHKGEHPGEGWREITRQVLAGSYGESCSFRVRYFEVGPGGHSSLEKHEHVHVVITLRGHGRAIVGASVHDVEPYDITYVPAWTPHQFVNDSEEPFGFLCIVDGDRDRPSPLSAKELAQLQANPETAAAIRLFEAE